jgi:hypothetical protein
MSKDELIIDILEKVHEKVEKSNSDIQDIKVEQVRQNLIVERHEQRSTASEGRLKILEKDAQFARNFVMTVSVLGACLEFYVLVLKPWMTHL